MSAGYAAPSKPFRSVTRVWRSRASIRGSIAWSRVRPSTLPSCACNAFLVASAFCSSAYTASVAWPGGNSFHEVVQALLSVGDLPLEAQLPVGERLLSDTDLSHCQVDRVGDQLRVEHGAVQNVLTDAQIVRAHRRAAIVMPLAHVGRLAVAEALLSKR